MKIIKDVSDLSEFLTANSQGCLADTSFLYALSYDDDRLYERATEIFELLAEKEVGIYANVISRMEFVDLIFRKQVTAGAIQLFGLINQTISNRALFNLLKNIRDTDTAEKRKGQSYKVGERKLKDLRREIEATADVDSWSDFCQRYIGNLLENEWSILEDDLGLNFVEILEHQTSELFEQPLLWTDLVKLMGQKGLRGPDAMILNFFSKSTIPLLVSGDGDFETRYVEDQYSKTEKAIFIL